MLTSPQTLPEADAITVRNLAKELQIVEHGPILHGRERVILDHRNEHLSSFGKHAIIDVTTDFFVRHSLRSLSPSEILKRYALLYCTSCCLNVTG